MYCVLIFAFGVVYSLFCLENTLWSFQCVYVTSLYVDKSNCHALPLTTTDCSVRCACYRWNSSVVSSSNHVNHTVAFGKHHQINVYDIRSDKRSSETNLSAPKHFNNTKTNKTRKCSNI